MATPDSDQAMVKNGLSVKGKRRRCVDCWRLEAQCLCSVLPCLSNEVELVFLQHPLEQYQVKGTARLAALSLENTDFWVGKTFGVEQQKAILGHGKQVFLLYPALEDSVKAISPTDLTESAEGWQANTCIIILDGTWKKTRKMLFVNPWLAELPRISLQPDMPSQYAETGLRKVKNAQSLSTLEAVQALLSQLEKDSNKYQSLSGVMSALMEQQQAFRPKKG